MLDGISLDQLRIFLAAVDEGSFSAAGRSIGRTQSAVSEALANFEQQLGIRLFRRSGRRPSLTPEGRALIDQARSVTRNLDQLKAQARGFSQGQEAELAIAADFLFPIELLAEAMVAYRTAFRTHPCAYRWRHWAVSSCQSRREFVLLGSWGRFPMHRPIWPPSQYHGSR